MKSVKEFIDRPPDLVNSQGEEIWENYRPNMAIVRLKPGTSSDKHYHKKTREIYGILYGYPILIVDGKSDRLHPHNLRTIRPGQVHQIINSTINDVIFAVISSIPWSPDDTFLV